MKGAMRKEKNDECNVRTSAPFEHDKAVFNISRLLAFISGACVCAHGLTVAIEIGR